jgi:hypothetical protein
MLQEKKRAMESLIFLTQMRNNTIKACSCVNNSMQRSYIPKDKATSPMMATEAIIITSVIEAKQGYNVIMLDVPNVFIQMPIPENKEKISMKICENLFYLLLETFPRVYNDYVVYERRAKHKMVYV